MLIHVGSMMESELTMVYLLMCMNSKAVAKLQYVFWHFALYFVTQ